jgi:hypothetical protein
MVIDLGRELTDKWTMNNFQLAGDVSRKLHGKLVVMNDLDLRRRGRFESNGEPIEPRVALIEGGSPTAMTKASAMSKLFREEAKRLDELACLVADAYKKNQSGSSPTNSTQCRAALGAIRTPSVIAIRA